MAPPNIHTSAVPQLLLHAGAALADDIRLTMQEAAAAQNDSLGMGPE